MELSREEQKRMLEWVENLFDCLQCDGEFEGWKTYRNVDRHSPCQHLEVITDEGVRIVMFAPNSTVTNHDQELFNTFGLTYGSNRENGVMEEYDTAERMMDCLVDEYRDGAFNFQR